ncbi:MAG: undecaprenyldiphospho-muramoylpentapeptide beta-N-acetylglucosaminyltransferase [Muribaculaceae bacterium]|nr:undecaprenyldiphospho-muramoylpentapeptide beta-N-acetylglucosaminyltransferase [Muribaculaceae bacterium]
MKVLISGGGTGGHIFPAISIANALRRRDPSTEILFVGAEGRMEMERVPAAGYDIVGLPVAGFNRRKLWKNVGVVVKLCRSMLKARKIMNDFRPDIAVGVGGYASGPMLKEAQRRGIPTLLQEQNSYPGVTNKLLARKAGAICVAYEKTERFFPEHLIEITGNPVRATLLECPLSQEEAKMQLGMDKDKLMIFVTGGSLGARTINEAVKQNLDTLTADGTQILWQTGKLYADECKQAAAGYTGVSATPFVSDMAVAYRAADLVVARAGACTISELQLLGKPAILIPSPNVAEDHQRKNGQALVDKGAARMVLDAEAIEKLPAVTSELIADADKRKLLTHNIYKMALPDADNKIVDRIYKILKK